MNKVLQIPISTYKRRRPSPILTPGSQKWVDKPAPLKLAKWKSKEEFYKATGRGDLFNTLAQLSQPAPGKDLAAREMFKKRAKAKYLTNGFLMAMIELDSPLKKGYANSLYCSQELKQDGDKITTKYCKNRWCMVCNRIRIGKCINGYVPQLSALSDPQFVTLTIPNVPRQDLREAMRGMVNAWTAIYKKLHRQGSKIKIKLRGIRKLECTYNAENDTYHPHFHFIVEHKAVAETILLHWLNIFPDASHLGQDIRPANENSIKELFKYFTKIVTKGSVYIPAMDQIFQAIKGFRVYQPFGIHAVNDEPDDLEAITLEENFESLAWWKWNGKDWKNIETGELLSGYTDTAAADKLFENLIS